MLEQEKISKIKVLLKAHPKGLTITDISTRLKLNRNSVAKYLEILQISGHVESQSYGTARVFFLSHRLPISALVTIASDPVVTLDENHHILHVNDIFCRLFEVKKEDIVGNHIVEIFKNGVASNVLPGVFSDVLADGEKVQDVHVITGSGEFYFKIKSMKTVFDDGSRGTTIVMEDVTREKKDQIELEAKEARYRGIVQDQTEFIIRFDSSGNLTFVNDAFAQYLGRTPEELVRTRFSDNVCEVSKAEFAKKTQTLSHEHPVTSFECRSTRAPSQVRWISWTLRAIFDYGERPVEFQAVGQDITEKKVAMEKVHDNITRMELFSKKLQEFVELPCGSDIWHAIGAGLAEIFPEAEIAVSSFDPQKTTVTIRAFIGQREFVSEQIGRDIVGMRIPVGGAPPPEGIFTGEVHRAQKDLTEVFFGQVPAETCAAIERELEIGGFYSVGLVWQESVLGHILFSLPKGRTLADPSLVNMYARAASIALRRHIAENALAESESLYRSVIDNMQDVFYRSDINGNLLMGSPSWAKMLGFDSPDEAMGRNIAEFYLEPEKRKEFLKALQATGSVTDYEVVLKKKDGTPLPISTNSHYYYDKDGTLLGIEGIFRDITERKAAEEKIHRYIGNMEFLSQKLLDFILMEPTENIYRKIASDFKNLVPGAIVIVNSFDKKTGIVTVRSTLMSDQEKEIVLRNLGKDPVDSGFPIDAFGLNSFRTGKLYVLDIPLYDVLFRSVPEPVCRQLETELGFKDVAAIGFVRGGEILGNATIFLPRGESIKDVPLVEMYAREASIAIQRYVAEEERRKSDEVFHNLAQSNPLPIALIEPDGTYLYVNESFTRLFGYDLHDFRTGREWFRLAFPDTVLRRTAIAVWKADLARSGIGETRTRTYPVRCKDSTIKEINFRQVTLSDGKQCIIYEDMTERKKAEQVQRLLSSIIESTVDAVISKDHAGTVISWNRAAEMLYGYSAEEMIGQSIMKIIPEEKRAEMEEINLRIREGNPVTSLETLRVRKDGRLIDVSVTISPIIDDSGTVIGASTIARDITSNKAEERLRANEEQYRSLVDNIAVGIYRSTGDPAGHFVWGNSSLVRILGYPSFDKLKEVEVADLFVEPDGRKKLLADLREQGFVKNREIDLKRADGTTASVLVTALARFDRSGALTCINGIVEDVTGQKQAESRIQSMTKEIQDVLAYIPDPLMIIDSGNSVVAWNAAMEHFIGVTRSQAIGTRDYARLFPFHEPSRPFLTELIDAMEENLELFWPGAHQEGTTIVAPAKGPAPDRSGKTVPLSIRVSPLLDAKGVRIGILTIIRNAAPADQGSSRLPNRGPLRGGDREPAAAGRPCPAGLATGPVLASGMPGLPYLSNALKQARDGIAILDLSCHCLWVNDSLTTLLGVKGSEGMIGKSVAQFVAGEFRKPVLEYFSKVKKHRAGGAIALSLLTPAGRVPVEATASVISDDSDAMLGFMVILKNTSGTGIRDMTGKEPDPVSGKTRKGRTKRAGVQNGKKP